MRQNGLMPRLAQPAGSEDAGDPIAHLGNLINAGILRYLRVHPNTTVGPIASALELRPTTIKPRLDQLDEAGLVISDPPASGGQPRRGVWITYRANDEAVTDLYLRLGMAIGEF